MLRSIYNAADAYALANGEWPTGLDELAVDIDWTGTTRGASGVSGKVKSNTDWSFRLAGSFSYAASVGMWRISGKYAGAGFVMWGKYVDARLPIGTLICIENHKGPFVIEEAGAYCEKIFKGKFLFNGTDVRYYSLP